jgi:hypothetical protein
MLSFIYKKIKQIKKFQLKIWNKFLCRIKNLSENKLPYNNWSQVQIQKTTFESPHKKNVKWSF